MKQLNFKKWVKHLMSNLTICRIKGIDIQLNISFSVLFLFFVFMLAPIWEIQSFFGYRIKYFGYVISTLFTIVFFISVLLHELAHVYVNLKYNISTPRVVFFILGAGAVVRGYFKNPKEEFLSAGAGLVVSGFVAIIFYGLYWFCEKILGYKLFVSGITTFFYIMGDMNLFLILINIVPAFPTDGGRCLRSLIWWMNGNITKSTLIATIISWVICALITVFIIIQNYQGKFWIFLAIFFIALGSLLEFLSVKTGKKELEILQEFFNKFKLIKYNEA